MKFLVGDATGLCKVIDIDKKAVTHKFGAQSRDGVQALHWSGPEDARESEVTVVHKSGLVHVYDHTFTKLPRTFQAPDTIIFSDFRANQLFLLSACGACRILAPTTDSQSTDCQSFQLPPPVSAACLHPTSLRMAFGGEENDLKIFDFETRTVIWKAKNLPNNHLDLRIPNRISAIAYTNGRIFVGTKDGNVRIYDPAVQRRPLLSVPVGYRMSRSCAYTATADSNTRAVMCCAVKAETLYMGDNVGNVCAYSLKRVADLKPCGEKAGRKVQLDIAKKEFPYLAGFKGVMGSVRDLACHAEEDVMAVVGLGRHAYVYRSTTRRLLAKIHLKQKLSAVLFSCEASKRCQSEDGTDDERIEEISDERIGRAKRARRA